MKYFCFLFFFLFLLGCQKESTERTYPISLNLSGYDVDNMYIYYGPNGNCDSIVNPSFIDKTWKRYLDMRETDTLQIKKDSVFFVEGSLRYGFASKTDSDIIYIQAGDGKWYYFGKWENGILRVRSSFRYVCLFKDEFDEFSKSKGEHIDKTSFNNLFNEDVTVKNPRDLIHVGDTIAWANINYIYR